MVSWLFLNFLLVSVLYETEASENVNDMKLISLRATYSSRWPVNRLMGLEGLGSNVHHSVGVWYGHPDTVLANRALDLWQAYMISLCIQNICAICTDAPVHYKRFQVIAPKLCMLVCIAMHVLSPSLTHTHTYKLTCCSTLQLSDLSTGVLLNEEFKRPFYVLMNSY